MKTVRRIRASNAVDALKIAGLLPGFEPEGEAKELSKGLFEVSGTVSTGKMSDADISAALQNSQSEPKSRLLEIEGASNAEEASTIARTRYGSLYDAEIGVIETDGKYLVLIEQLSLAVWVVSREACHNDSNNVEKVFVVFKDAEDYIRAQGDVRNWLSDRDGVVAKVHIKNDLGDQEYWYYAQACQIT